MTSGSRWLLAIGGLLLLVLPVSLWGLDGVFLAIFFALIAGEVSALRRGWYVVAAILGFFLLTAAFDVLFGVAVWWQRRG